MKTALIIGGGPAGLMAASVLANAGVGVTIADAMPSLGRKFLMAGKSGLNLTKAEPSEAFQNAYGDLHPTLKSALDAFGPTDVSDWATALGQELFTGTTGRVFPKAMKASPLLRAWLGSISATVLTRHAWQGWDVTAAIFDTPDGRRDIAPDVTILALGGASWSKLGSNGAWAQFLPDAVTDFKPANVGFAVNWSSHMARHLGAPIKGTALTCGGLFSRGEWVISKSGIEGGGIYSISAAARDGAPIYLDLKPDWSENRVRDALKRPRGKASQSNYLRKVLKLDAAKIALLSEFGRPFPADIAPLIKHLEVEHDGPNPIDQAISTAGGVRFDALTDTLMLKSKAGVFCAGEMLDWEAPTGGYLITACLATGKLVGEGALTYLNR